VATGMISRQKASQEQQYSYDEQDEVDIHPLVNFAKVTLSLMSVPSITTKSLG
jgi:hypothetical protein